MEHYWAGELVLVPEVLQRSVAKVFLTTEVPHAGFDAPLDPLCRWPFLHVLGRRAGVFLDAFPESFPHLTICADKGTSTPEQVRELIRKHGNNRATLTEAAKALPGR